MGARMKRFRNAALSGISHDIHADVKQDEGIMQMHEAAEKFDPRTETVFKVLQVISACAMSFAHGEWVQPFTLRASEVLRCAT
jgi:sodium-dependent phosphate transporter